MPEREYLPSHLGIRHGTRRTRAAARFPVRRRQFLKRFDHQFPQYGAMATCLILTKTSKMQRETEGCRGQEGDNVSRIGLSHFSAIPAKELSRRIHPMLVASHQFGTRSENRKPNIEKASRHIGFLPNSPGHLPGHPDAEPFQILTRPISVAADDHVFLF